MFEYQKNKLTHMEEYPRLLIRSFLPIKIYELIFFLVFMYRIKKNYMVDFDFEFLSSRIP